MKITTREPGLQRARPRQPSRSEQAVARPEAEQQHREGEQDVDEARDRGVDPAAVEAGDQSHGHADEHGQAGADERDLERHLGAVEHAREDVAAELVDAERVLAARALREAEVVERFGRLHVRRGRAEQLRDRAGERRAHDQGDDEAERPQRDLVAPQAAPEQLQRRPRGDRRATRDDLVDAGVLGVQQIAGACTRAHATPSRLATAVMIVCPPPVHPDRARRIRRALPERPH